MHASDGGDNKMQTEVARDTPKEIPADQLKRSVKEYQARIYWIVSRQRRHPNVQGNTPTIEALRGLERILTDGLPISEQFRNNVVRLRDDIVHTN
jgi:hypothetical protein